ncbi:MAG TPA: mismatch-specific DNA-glycosylase [Dehalococcoidia bacterium]|nr:mismatch-specific DNA-glycosylase [Dehalococcoidia bacterium]
MRQGVPDYLRLGLRLVIVGINPGLRSGATGHHYAYAGNHFWPLLFDSGLLPERLTYESDHRALEFDIGLTNLCERTTKEANELTREEMAAGAAMLRAKLLDFAPRVVCFNGMGIYDALLANWPDVAPVGKRRKIAPGLQPERLGTTQLFVVPSSSGRTAAYPRQIKLGYFRELKQLVDSLPVEASA